MATTIPLTLIELPNVPPERDQLLIERARQATIAARLLRLREQVTENDRRIAALTRERIAFAAAEHVAQQSAPRADDTAKPLVFSDGSPVVGDALHEVARLGTVGAYERLREISERDWLRLDVPVDRETAEGRLFKHATVGGAASITEAVHALARSRRIEMAELRRDGALYAGLVEAVVTIRPDLRDREGYGSRRDMTAKPSRAELRAKFNGEVASFMSLHALDPGDGRDKAEAMQTIAARNPRLMSDLYDSEQDEAPPTPESVRAKHFAETVDELIRDQDLARTPENVAKASRAIRKRHPELVQPAGGRGRV